jgi:hypothetical protein
VWLGATPAWGYFKMSVNQVRMAHDRLPRPASGTISIALAILSALLFSFPSTAGAASAMPQPASYNRLASVSCVSSADCWAVGSAQDMNNNVNGETLHWDGSSWAAVASPAATGASLESVSCTSSSSCWAVGDTGNGQKSPRPLIVRWDGSSWASVSAPHLHTEVLQAISCSSSTNCFAVGTYDRFSRMLALRWNGSKWTQSATPDVSTRYGQALTTVTCVSTRSCWAFGYYYAAPLAPTVTGYLIALHWNGSVWQRQWTSAPYYGADSSASFQLAIACTSSSSCWTVGDWSITPLYYHPLIVRWNGHRWAMQNPPKFKSASLYGVACSSTRNCWAVGDVGTSYGGTTHNLALHTNGSRWTRAATPGGSNYSLVSVACTSSASCWAVGNNQPSAGDGLNFALHWNGSAWSAF